jgi:hypothetical protein
MLGLLILLLVIWLVCIFVGAIIKGLIWLLVIGVVLFLVTGVFGFIKRETFGRRR